MPNGCEFDVPRPRQKFAPDIYSDWCLDHGKSDGSALHSHVDTKHPSESHEEVKPLRQRQQVCKKCGTLDSGAMVGRGVGWDWYEPAPAACAAVQEEGGGAVLQPGPATHSLRFLACNITPCGKAVYHPVTFSTTSFHDIESIMESSP